MNYWEYKPNVRIVFFEEIINVVIGLFYGISNDFTIFFIFYKVYAFFR